jgi:hypothetical protein
MEKEKKDERCVPKKWRAHDHGATGSGIYFFGIIGAAVYYIQHATGFWPIILAALKAIIWPAFLIYKVFVLLNM